MYVCASSLGLKKARGGSQIPWNQRAAMWVLKIESAFSVRAAGTLHCGAGSPATSELPCKKGKTGERKEG